MVECLLLEIVPLCYLNTFIKESFWLYPLLVTFPHILIQQATISLIAIRFHFFLLHVIWVLHHVNWKLCESIHASLSHVLAGRIFRGPPGYFQYPPHGLLVIRLDFRTRMDDKILLAFLFCIFTES